MWFYCSFATKKEVAGERRRKRKKKETVLHWTYCTPCWPCTSILHMVRVMERFTENTYLALLSLTTVLHPIFSAHSPLYSLCGAVRSIHFSWLYLPFIFWICCVFVPKMSRRVSRCVFCIKCAMILSPFPQFKQFKMFVFLLVFYPWWSHWFSLLATSLHLSHALSLSHSLCLACICVW